MRDPNEEILDITEGDGKRRRNRSAFWLFFRIAAWVICIAAGITAIIAGYREVLNPSDRLERMYSPNSSAWEIHDVRSKYIDSYNEGVYYNSGSGNGKEYYYND